jgi:Carboxypeptidase regulatory-like domain
MKRALSVLFLFGVVLATVLVATPSVKAAPPRKGTSTLRGLVLGPDDKPVAHAGVTYQSSSGSSPHAVYTDAHGRFTIRKLYADNYDLRASAKGVFSEWEKNVTLHRGQTREITLRLIYAREMPKGWVKKNLKP